MQLWLIRHAQPLIASGICYGQTDVPADAAATHAVAQALANELPPGTLVTASTLQRCELLAHSLYGLRPDLRFKTSANLCEINFGDWEAKPWNAIARSDIDAWTADFADYRVGGHGESTRAVVLRALQALIDMSTNLPGNLAANLATNLPASVQAEPQNLGAAQPDAVGVAGSGCAAWITHAGVIRAVNWIIRSLAQAQRPLKPLALADWPQNAPAFGRWQLLHVPLLLQPRQLRRLQAFVALH